MFREIVNSISVKAADLVRQDAKHGRLISSGQLGALKAAGTTHIYADTADYAEIQALPGCADNAIYTEIDGNTVNQPLVHKVIDRYLDSIDPRLWREQLHLNGQRASREELMVLFYTVLSARIANDLVSRVAAGRRWETSLQLHMKLTGNTEEARQIARLLRRLVPGVIVKVPFAPHQPNCFLLARALEQESIPVNFTSTFSARQAMAAAMLANTTLTNIFLGRLNQGLHAKLLGEQVVLEAQRGILRQRHEAGIKTMLIAASLREWRSFERLAGCDVFTAPCPVIAEFLNQHELRFRQMVSRLQSSYLDDLGISQIGKRIVDGIPVLYRIEPEFLSLLNRLRAGGGLERMRDGDELQNEFERAGFGDFFHSPNEAQWTELRKNKLPDLNSNLTGAVALDTLYSLLADADFDKYQDEMDAQLGHKFSFE